MLRETSMSKVHCEKCGCKEADEGDGCLNCSSEMKTDCCNASALWDTSIRDFYCMGCKKQLYPPVDNFAKTPH